MFGIKEFHSAATASGIKPILGIEAYVARRSRFEKKERQVMQNSGSLASHKFFFIIFVFVWYE